MSDEEANMNIHAPKVRYEVNLNTIIVTCGFVAMAVGWGITWGQTTNDVKALLEFRVNATAELRRLDNLAFQVTANEQATKDVSAALSELKDAVSEQGGDIKVMREILQRIERQGQTSALRSYPFTDAADL
ncbi:hypothetical protein VE25_07295 [Devosia geojensis]|uniref:Uncharacterized protein n=1 Tax=Devosia geojensis TaxID=443610 RepID=A0A0F5FVZ1_9HYPH|nr:hypothetical protein [Devosia geojensis]KKB12357.1 hypothetical protein VE25_07295 [Devosia geojensis]